MGDARRILSELTSWRAMETLGEGYQFNPRGAEGFEVLDKGQVPVVEETPPVPTMPPDVERRFQNWEFRQPRDGQELEDWWAKVGSKLLVGPSDRGEPVGFGDVDEAAGDDIDLDDIISQFEEPEAPRKDDGEPKPKRKGHYFGGRKAKMIPRQEPGASALSIKDLDAAARGRFESDPYDDPDLTRQIDWDAAEAEADAMFGGPAERGGWQKRGTLGVPFRKNPKREAADPKKLGRMKAAVSNMRHVVDTRLKKSSEKEKHEHPWMSDKEAMQVAKDHERLGEGAADGKRCAECGRPATKLCYGHLVKGETKPLCGSHAYIPTVPGLYDQGGVMCDQCQQEDWFGQNYSHGKPQKSLLHRQLYGSPKMDQVFRSKE